MVGFWGSVLLWISFDEQCRLVPGRRGRRASSWGGGEKEGGGRVSREAGLLCSLAHGESRGGGASAIRASRE